MKCRFLLAALFMMLGLSSLRSQDDIGNEYRITAFPSHPVTDKLTALAYLGYVWNPAKGYQTYYLGWPAAIYTPKSWLQIWGGLLSIYTDNESKASQLELRPFAGAKTFLPNKIKWNIYAFPRYEYRTFKNMDTKEWTDYSRLRLRVGVEFPLSNLKNAWQPDQFYGLADVEPYIRLDNGKVDPLRIRGGLGYILKKFPVRFEGIYHLQYTQPNESNKLMYTDNIYRLNIKISMHQGLLNKLFNPSFDD